MSTMKRKRESDGTGGDHSNVEDEFPDAEDDPKENKELSEKDSERSESDEEEEIEQDPPLLRRIKHGLESSLGGLSTAMSFASSSLSSVVENPGIYLHYGCGNHRSSTFRERCETHFGGSPSSSIWETLINAVLNWIRTELKICDGDIMATPYKILLYETDTMFKEHREYVSKKILVVWAELIQFVLSVQKRSQTCSAPWCSASLRTIRVVKFM